MQQALQITTKYDSGECGIYAKRKGKEERGKKDTAKEDYKNVQQKLCMSAHHHQPVGR